MNERDPRARLAELWLDDRTVGLVEDEAQELISLEQALRLEADPALDQAAAALHLAVDQPTESLPASLADRLVASFSEDLAADDDTSAPSPDLPMQQAIIIPWEDVVPGGSSSAELAESAANAEAPRRVESPRAPPPESFRSGWARVAAAAVLAAAAGAGGATFLQNSDTGSVAQAEPSLSERRQALLAGAQDIVHLEWNSTDDTAAKGASGDLVWSPSLQQGFMRFRGLAQNAPEQSRYQLWIFDAKRDERFPVDGGVFDVAPSTRDIIVPITAKLPVSAASLFAVTVEPPEGVVVSKRERIVLTAQPK